MNAVALPRDPTAVIGRRIVAWLVDIVIVIAVAIVAARGIVHLKRVDIPANVPTAEACDRLTVNLTVKTCFTINDTAYYTDSSGAGAVLSGLPTLVGLLNWVILTGLVGGSIGKLLVGLRVVRRDTGQICGIGKALIRWLLWIVDAFPYCLPLVGFITALATKEHRRVGDMAAGTLVVDKSDVGFPTGTLVGAAPNPYAPSPYAPGGFTPPPAGGGWPAPPAPAPWGAAPPASPPTQSAPPSAWGTPVNPPPQPSTWTTPMPAASNPPAPSPVIEPTPSVDPTPAPAPAASEPKASEPKASEPKATEPETSDAASAPKPASTDGPQWDAARNAYIHWDPAASHWLQWDDTAKKWTPIS